MTSIKVALKSEFNTTVLLVLFTVRETGKKV